MTNTPRFRAIQRKNTVRRNKLRRAKESLLLPGTEQDFRTIAVTPHGRDTFKDGQHHYPGMLYESRLTTQELFQTWSSLPGYPKKCFFCRIVFEEEYSCPRCHRIYAHLVLRTFKNFCNMHQIDHENSCDINYCDDSIYSIFPERYCGPTPDGLIRVGSIQVGGEKETFPWCGRDWFKGGEEIPVYGPA